MTAARLAAIDCDLHPTVPGLKALMPHLAPIWQETVTRRGLDEMLSIAYPANAPITVRADWRGPNRQAASTAEALAADALAPFGIGTAILNCLYGTQTLFSDDLAAVFCRALNDWIAAEFLDKNPAFRASIIVPMTNAELAVDEIDHRAADPRFVQVLMLVGGEIPPGRRQNWPIYAAAERHHLPVGFHAGSLYRHPTTPVGWASSFTEDYASQAAAFASALTSLIAEGVFAKYPDLTVVLLESGVSWLPAHLWRLTKFWKGLRSEIPWVADPPISIVRDRVRLTLQPFDAPPDPAHVSRLMEHLGSDEMLLFSTDYPHWQFDGTDPIPDGLSPALAHKIKIENPLKTYPRLRKPTS